MHRLSMAGVLLSVIGGLGCSAFSPTPHNNYTVYIDQGISADHQEVALQALQDWHIRTGVVFDISITSDTCSGDHCIQLWEADEGELGQSKDLESCDWAGVMGCTTSSPFDDNGAWHVRVMRDMGGWPDGFRGMVYKHETGHAIGLSHMNGQVLMSPTYDTVRHEGTLEITAIDVEQYWEVRN